jgi:hypothetical protein
LVVNPEICILHRYLAGDIHLAMFRVRKMRVEVPTPSEAEGAEQETKTEVVSAAAVEDTAS